MGAELGSSEQGARKVTMKLVVASARVTASAASWQEYDGLEHPTLALSSVLVLCSSVGFGGRRDLTWRGRISRCTRAQQPKRALPGLSSAILFLLLRLVE